MKKYLILLSIPLFISLQSCDKDDDDNNTSSTNQTTSTSLTADEITDLLYLREEEKLAHNVYIYAYQKYTVMIFQNIANSEQTHTKAVLDMLTKYKLDDPAANKAIGEFNDSSLQQLYTDLTTIVDSSQTHAFTVGATIEDLDIFDLSENIKRSSKADILKLYNDLMCGSRNHLRSYIGKLNGNYSPQYLTLSDYNAIISSPKENCGI